MGGFFAEFSAWLNTLLANYIFAYTRVVAETLEPAIVTLGVIYLLIWGVLQITGQIEQPLLAALKRFAMLALIFGVGLQQWLYHEVIVETFFTAPARLAGAIVGAYDSVGVVDGIIRSGDLTAELLLEKGGVFEGLSFTIAGYAVYLIVGFTAIYAIFLLSLSRIALSVLLALGPLFIALLFFESTRRFAEAWLAQLANYAFIAILTVLVAALMLTVLRAAALQALAQGGAIQIAHAVRVCMTAGLTLLVMRQVMPMAAALASGISLSTFNFMSGALTRAGGLLGQFSRGALMDKDTSRWDPMSRKSGYYAGRAAMGLIKAPFTVPRALARRYRRNTIRGS
jgi:type IV secretion system protein VirB6